MNLITKTLANIEHLIIAKAGKNGSVYVKLDNLIAWALECADSANSSEETIMNEVANSFLALKLRLTSLNVPKMTEITDASNIGISENDVISNRIFVFALLTYSMEKKKYRAVKETKGWLFSNFEGGGLNGHHATLRELIRDALIRDALIRDELSSNMNIRILLSSSETPIFPYTSS